MEKIKKSTILFIGIIILLSGVFFISYDYLKTKKENAFTKMNILLYEHETPEVIEDDEELEEIIEPEEPVNQEIKKQPTSTWKGYDFIGTLEIPKLNLKRGFVSIGSKYNNINYNITIIQGSTMPDEENNNLIFAAHSGYCSICFFSELYKLKIGDKAYLDYKGKRYSYKIVNIYNVPKTGQVEIKRNPNTNVLTLITCTRNSDTKQTVYIFEIE